MSLPMRGEWIEMHQESKIPPKSQSLPMRGEWIEMIDRKHGPAAIQPSLPMRGEWIEI